MAAQSFAMGHAFGTSFQYGKRKISSMTNEEFNALSATDLHGELQADIRAMIPNMNQSFKTMEQFQIDIINSMVNTLKIAAQQFFEWITTGKVTSGTGVQTDTSATNIDFNSGIFDVQGGSRQETPGSFIPNIESYEAWLASQGFGPEAQAEKKAQNKHVHTQAHHFTRTTSPPIVDTSQLVGAGVSKETDAIKKAALQNNIAKWSQLLKQQSETLKRVEKLKQPAYTPPKSFGARQKQQAVQAKWASFQRGKLITIKRLTSLIKDLIQKIAGAQRLLRNYR